LSFRSDIDDPTPRGETLGSYLSNGRSNAQFRQVTKKICHFETSSAVFSVGKAKVAVHTATTSEAIQQRSRTEGRDQG